MTDQWTCPQCGAVFPVATMTRLHIEQWHQEGTSNEAS